MNPESTPQQASNDPQQPTVDISSNVNTLNTFPSTSSSPMSPTLPGTPKPTTSISKKKMFATIVIAIVLIAVGYSIYAYINRGVPTLGANGKSITIANNPKAVNEQFMIDIFNNNMKGAYDLTSTNFKSADSESKFAATEKTLAVKELTTSNIVLSTGKTTVINGNITAHNIHIFSYSSRMIKQNGLWRVDNLYLGS